jgi:ABC-2 type transport system ATP-binding protein
MTAIEADGLYKYYGTQRAVAGLHLSVEPGTTLGFLGPNGAGKSTTINILTTLVRPTAGTARVAGYDVATEAVKVRQSIGIVFQESTLDQELTAAENLRFQAELCGLRWRESRPVVGAMLEMLGLADKAKVPVRHLSGGLRRRLEIARGLVHAPKVLFLDEPTTGLDTQTRAVVWEYLDKLRSERDITIFFTTHQMEEAEHCDEIVIIDHGSSVARGTPVELKSLIGADLICLRTQDDAAAADELRDRFGLDAQPAARELRFRAERGDELVPRLCRELGVRVLSARVSPPSLDDVFLHHTGREIREEPIGPRELADLEGGNR